MRAVLWDADGVLQHTHASSWDLAVQVVAQIPDALIGAPIDEDRIRAAAHRLGLGDRVDDIVAVWSKFDLRIPSLKVVSLVRAAGTACYLATNQDAYRAARMRQKTPYGEILDGAYFSCDIGWRSRRSPSLNTSSPTSASRRASCSSSTTSRRTSLVPDRPALRRSAGRTTTESPGCATSSMPTAFGWMEVAT